MCFRCELCLEVAPPRATRRTWPLTREVPVTYGTKPTRTEIVREIICCATCHALLSRGTPLEEVRRRGPTKVTTTPVFVKDAVAAVEGVKYLKGGKVVDTKSLLEKVRAKQGLGLDAKPR